MVVQLGKEPGVNQTDIIERYLSLIADPSAGVERIAELLDADMRFVERPNLVNPRGSTRDVAQVLTSVGHGRSLLEAQRFDIVDHVVAGDTIATRVVWTGTLAVDAPPYRAGSCIRADSFMRFTLRDGRIAQQENYDCFHPQAAAELRPR
jgi:ketosteroid isomerase-like protein